jgi:hypothetical protein
VVDEDGPRRCRLHEAVAERAGRPKKPTRRREGCQV